MSVAVPDVLHEREAELTLLAQSLDDALGGTGRAVLVEGSAGIGKTRLLDEACARAAGRARILRGRGGEQERDIPLLVTREMFAPLMRTTATPELDRYFTGAADLAGPLLGRGTAAATTLDTGFAVVHGMYWLVANLAEEQPLVLAVDDLHWVDESTQRWLAYLLPRVSELPVLVVLAVRPRELAPESPASQGLASTHDVRHLRPGSLSRAAATHIVRATLPEAAEAFCAAAHRTSGGNPLLLRSLATAARDRGVHPSAEAADRLLQLGELGLGRIVLPRLHGLGDDAVALARAVALLGDGCSLQEAADLAGVERANAATALDGLVRREFLRPDGDPVFTHPLVRAVVIDELTPGARGTLHDKAARVLNARNADPERVARHLAATDPIGEAWAVETLLAAASAATARGAPEAGITHLAAALREGLDVRTRACVLLDAGWHAFRCHDRRGRAWLEEALRIAPDPATAVQAWLAAWNWKLILLDGHDPDTVHDGLPEHLEGDLAYAVAGNALLDFGFTGACMRDHLDRYPVPDPVPAGTTLFERMWLSARAMDAAMTCRDREEAMTFADLASGDDRLQDEGGDFANLAWILISRLSIGELSVAEQQGLRALEHARRHGSQLASEWYLVAVAWTQLLRGDIHAAEASMVDWLDRPPELRARVVQPSCIATIVLTHLNRGRLPEAYELLDRSGYRAGPPRSDFHGAALLHARGQLHLAAGDARAALGDFEACGDVLASFGAARNTFLSWRLGAAQSHALLGNDEAARTLAEEQLADARAWGAAPLLGASLRTLGTVTGGEPGVDLAREAVSLLASSDARGEHAQALLALGRLLRLAHQPAAAREPLQQALDLADRLGAVILAGDAESELRLTGARPRRRAVTGVHALTPAELRVATLAAKGKSNPEIAQSLFVTRKTVEKHLGSAFLKLQISSRQQLPAVLDPAADR
jgi:DNA-binding CsgD family transcriptional regulator